MLDRAGHRETRQSAGAVVGQKTIREWKAPEFMSFKTLDRC